MAPEVFGSHPVTYQWYKDGLPLAAGTNRTLTLTVTSTNDIGFYTVQVENALASSLSEPAFLSVTDGELPPVILTRGPYLQQNTPASIRVLWRTDAPTYSEVRYGTNLNNLDQSAVSLLAAVHHDLLLDRLESQTRYFYEIWNTHSNLAGGEGYQFTTAPTLPKPIRVWAQGDAGTVSPEARRVADAYLAFTGDRGTDVWLMLGDNAYASGSDGNYQAALFDMFPDILRRQCLWPTIGNHDLLSTDLNGITPYFNIFALPTQGEAGGLATGDERYYSFNHGNIHFVCLDSEQSDNHPGSPMLQWLEADLEANTNDWLIAYWHSPPYTHGSHNSDDISDSFGNLVSMRENVVPVLEAHGVDLVLCGHSHVYERSFLLNGHHGYSGTLLPEMARDAGDGRLTGTGAYRKGAAGPGSNEGAVYVVAGSSGQVTFGTLDHPVMVIGLLRLGSVVLDIDGLRLDARFLTDTGEVADHFTMLKGAAPESLRIATVRIADHQLHLAWKSISGRSYEVRSSPQLEPQAWGNVAGPIQATGATTFWSTPISGASTGAVYRVWEVP
jgi:hypothetical protein